MVGTTSQKNDVAVVERTLVKIIQKLQRDTKPSVNFKVIIILLVIRLKTTLNGNPTCGLY